MYRSPREQRRRVIRIQFDGPAEIVVASAPDWDDVKSSPTIQVIKDREDRWIQARRIWNQHTYHVTNVREDGTYLLGQDVVTLADLQRSLISAVKEKPGQKVLVRADERALHGTVAAAVLTCKNSGIHEAHIGYDLPQ